MGTVTTKNKQKSRSLKTHIISIYNLWETSNVFRVQSSNKTNQVLVLDLELILTQATAKPSHPNQHRNQYHTLWHKWAGNQLLTGSVFAHSATDATVWNYHRVTMWAQRTGAAHYLLCQSLFFFARSFLWHQNKQQFWIFAHHQRSPRQPVLSLSARWIV